MVGPRGEAWEGNSVKKRNNLDFVYLAILPFVAVVAFLVIYVYGIVPTFSTPKVGLPGSSYLLGVRTDTRKHVGEILLILGIVAAATIAFTWVLMMALDLRTGAIAFVRWILRRPPRLVSGLLRPEIDETWTWEKAQATDSEPLYRTRIMGWQEDETHTSSTL
jgi:hypothetical protein